jgi:hypothetical protein
VLPLLVLEKEFDVQNLYKDFSGIQDEDVVLALRANNLLSDVQQEADGKPMSAFGGSN